jgi:hypothetical protein
MEPGHTRIPAGDGTRNLIAPFLVDTRQTLLCVVALLPNGGFDLQELINMLCALENSVSRPHICVSELICFKS